MTINSTTRKTNNLVGNGNTHTYPFAFKVFQDSEIVVKKLETATSVETTLTLGASNDYIVTLNSDQKRILREYINSVDSTPTLMEFYNSEVSNLKSIFEKSIPNINDKALVIKLNEVKKFLTPISKTQKVTGELQFYSLTNKLN